MAFPPVRAFLPRLRTQLDTGFCSFPETTDTAPCLSNKLHPDVGGVRQKRRGREVGGVRQKRREDPVEGGVRQKKGREDPEEGRVRQKKGREDPVEGGVRQKKREDPEEGGVRQKRRGREDPEEGGVRQKKGREDLEEGGVRQKRRGREDPEKGGVKQKRREDPEEGGVRQKRRGQEDPEEGGVKQKRREDPEEGGVRQKRRGREVPEEGGVRQKRRGREDPEEGGVKQKRREDPGEGGVRQKRREDPEEGGVRQKRRGREDPEEGGVRQKRRGRKDPEEGRVRREDPEEGLNLSKRTCLSSYSRAHFEALYEELERLGDGGYGSVFAGSRKEDCLPVAIKHIPMEKVQMLPSYLRTAFPLEVTLMLKAAGEPGSEGPGAAVHLLDWFQLDQELILVQERPVPFVDLLTYMESNRSQLQELHAKMILHQVLKGIVGLHSRGVLHCDIKPENLLIETGSDTPRVRIIDLGCGRLLHNGIYSQITGTALYTPPEWFQQGSYRAGPMTVWQVGVVLYNMLTGLYPFKTTEEILLKELRIQFEMSSNCQDFLRRCLTKRPLGRPTLENLLLHPWLQ